MPQEQPVTWMWFRRDLRLHDNAALSQAVASGGRVVPVFIFDTDILRHLNRRDDARLEFIWRVLRALHEQLRQAGKSGFVFRIGSPEAVWQELLDTYPTDAVYLNHDYEPYARHRDARIAEMLHSRGARMVACKDQVVFEKSEILSGSGSPYTVYTPYSKRWLAEFQASPPASYPTVAPDAFSSLEEPSDIPALDRLGFRPSSHTLPPIHVAPEILRSYAARRDYPALDATTRVGIHLRFGTASVRQLARTAATHSEVWLKELVWREFFMQILWHFPHVVGNSFRPEYDAIPWRNDPRHIQRWKEGTTGYPLVDAGMRELANTGHMHNRVRMVVASFLTKHLLCDWRIGEEHFAQLLLDFELASNNGNWQWAAGCGCDAAPYFRVFNPSAQAEKFDSSGEYIRRWIPELGTSQYPSPVVDHTAARLNAISTYKEALERYKQSRVS